MLLAEARRARAASAKADPEAPTTGRGRSGSVAGGAKKSAPLPKAPLGKAPPGTPPGTAEPKALEKAKEPTADESKLRANVVRLVIRLRSE